jgi:hypothetical protein
MVKGEMQHRQSASRLQTELEIVEHGDAGDDRLVDAWSKRAMQRQNVATRIDG